MKSIASDRIGLGLGDLLNCAAESLETISCPL